MYRSKDKCFENRKCQIFVLVIIVECDCVSYCTRTAFSMITLRMILHNTVISIVYNALIDRFQTARAFCTMVPVVSG